MAVAFAAIERAVIRRVPVFSGATLRDPKSVWPQAPGDEHESRSTFDAKGAGVT
jgi:hypothetical protein